jgi:hypothetical protein
MIPPSPAEDETMKVEVTAVHTNVTEENFGAQRNVF